MLTFGIYALTAVLVLDCLFLILLVLVQLPKKEAGMGQAFGGAATDALFGAGSGNVLTKATKWGAGVFFVLAIALTLMGAAKTPSGGAARLQKLMSETKTANPQTVAAPTQKVDASTAPKAPALNLQVPTNPTPAANNSPSK